MPRLALVLAAAILAACHKDKTPRPGAAVPAAAATVVAVVNGEEITQADLDKALDPDYRKAERELFDRKQQILEGMVLRKLVLAEAKKQGVTEEAFFKHHIDAKVVAPTELDARAFFEQNQQAMGGAPYEAVKDRILAALSEQAQSRVAADLFQTLRAGAKIEMRLPEPDQPRVDVAAVGPSRGPDDAPITIVEFSDFQCPYCGKASKTVEKVLADYAGKVRLVFRDFPLGFHDKAFKAAEAGRCAQEQGKFWEMHDRMFGDQGHLDADSLKKGARSVGLDGGKFDACLDSGRFADAIRENLAAGQKAGVQGTPAFFINGRFLSGAQPYEEFRRIVEKELSKAAD